MRPKSTGRPESATNLRRATALWPAPPIPDGGKLDEPSSTTNVPSRVPPTAEAHTFLGWSLASRADWRRPVPSASARSRRPDFGNPYNGIGVYLMQQGKL